MRSKTIRADKRYLLLPVGESGGWFAPVEQTQHLGIYRNGELLEEYEVILDPFSPSVELPIFGPVSRAGTLEAAFGRWG